MLVQKSYEYFLDPALDFIGISRMTTTQGEVSEADDYLRGFQQRWGDVEDETLWHVTENALDMDAAFGVAVLYHKNVEFHARIGAMFTSMNPWHRWTSVLLHGMDRMDFALSALCDLVQEDYQAYSTYSIDYWLLVRWRILIPDLLVRYHNPVVVPALTQALRQTLSIQHGFKQATIHIDSYQDLFRNETLLPSIQNALIKALAAYRAWGALTGLPANNDALIVWSVTMAVTAVRDRFEVRSFHHWSEYPAFRDAVQRELMHRFGMTDEEQEQALLLYEKSSAFQGLTIRHPYQLP